MLLTQHSCKPALLLLLLLYVCLRPRRWNLLVTSIICCRRCINTIWRCCSSSSSCCFRFSAIDLQHNTTPTHSPLSFTRHFLELLLQKQQSFNGLLSWKSQHQKDRKHLKNVGPIRHCELPHALLLHCHSPGVATVARRHCRTPPAHRCPLRRQRQRRQQQRQRVTERTAMAP